jgi:hypothetical protein
VARKDGLESRATLRRVGRGRDWDRLKRQRRVGVPDEPGPTPRQVRLLKRLCEERGIPYEAPDTVSSASVQIAALLKRPTEERDG